MAALSRNENEGGARDVPARSALTGRERFGVLTRVLVRGCCGPGRPALRSDQIILPDNPGVLFNSSMNHTGPPHNPGVRELIEGKRKWASSLTIEQAKAGFKGWH